MSNALARLSVPPLPPTDAEPAFTGWYWDMALAAWEAMCARPRTRRAWVHVYENLWNARSQALKLGLVTKGSSRWEYITARVDDARTRLDLCDFHARRGEVNSRV